MEYTGVQRAYTKLLSTVFSLKLRKRVETKYFFLHRHNPNV